MDCLIHHNLVAISRSNFAGPGSSVLLRAHCTTSRIVHGSQTVAALVLLSDGHARQARTLQHFLRRRERTSSIPTAFGKSASRPPPAPSSKNLATEGSLCSSAMVSSTASMGGTGTVADTGAVDDMLALERALQAIGSQPLFSSGLYQPTGAGGHQGVPGGRYLSSTLGDSFFLVNNRQAAAREGASLAWEGGSSALGSSRHSRGAGRGAAASLRKPSSVAVAAPPRTSAGTEESPFSRQGASTALPAASNLSRSRKSSSSTATASSTPLSSSVGSGTVGGGGGFLEGVEAVQQGEVVRLLACMKTLGDENALLIKRAEDGERARQENERIRRETLEFQELYAKRFKGLRAALEEFREKYPHESNPANHVASLRETARVKSLEAEVESLTVRLKREKEAGRKKDAMLARYQAWYTKLRQSVGQKKSAAAGNGMAHQQQLLGHQQKLGVRGSSACSGGNSNIRPPQGR